MTFPHIDYSKFNDKEWMGVLYRIPPEESAYDYFFNIKCKSFLSFISYTVLNKRCYKEIWGEFYELLSKDDWKLIRGFTPSDNASLTTYLSRCAVRHFTNMAKEEKKVLHISLSDNEEYTVAEILNNLGDEKSSHNEITEEAFDQLCERDKKLLQYLVIEGRAAIDVADEIWPYIKTEISDWRTIPRKRVQDTLAMLKRRALVYLSIRIVELKNKLIEK